MGRQCDHCNSFFRPIVCFCKFLHSVLISFSCTEDFYGVFPTLIYGASLAIILLRLRKSINQTQQYTNISQEEPRYKPSSSRAFFKKSSKISHSSQTENVQQCDIRCDWKKCFIDLPKNILEFLTKLWYCLDPGLIDRTLQDLILFCIFILSLRIWIFGTRILGWVVKQVFGLLHDVTKDLGENLIVSFLVFIQAQQEFIYVTLCWVLCIVPANYASNQYLHSLDVYYFGSRAAHYAQVLVRVLYTLVKMLFIKQLQTPLHQITSCFSNSLRDIVQYINDSVHQQQDT